MSELGHNGGPSLDDDAKDVEFDRDGWIAVARSIREHWLVGFGQSVTPANPDLPTHSRTEAWLDLLMECRYEAGTVNNGGKRMRLERGQLLGAVSWLASRWNWSPKTVRGFLDKLENEGMIVRFSPGIDQCPDGVLNGNQKGKQKGKQSSILTISKYSLYQLGKRNEGQADGQGEGTQRARKGHAEGNIYKEETKEQGNKVDTFPDGKVVETDVSTPPPEAPILIAEPDPKPKVEKDPDPDGETDSQANVRALDCFHQWNELAQRIGLPMTRTLTPQRRQKLKARLREHGGMEAWTLALANIERSAFLRGSNDRGWRADFDFLVQASSFAKVVDGTYGNGAHGNNPDGEKETKAERIKRLMANM